MTLGTLDVGAAADVLRGRLPSVPRVAVVLGSGLGDLVELLTDSVAVAFHDLPGLPESSVPGHDGRFVFGRLDGTEVLIQAGRYHSYEGHSMDVVVAPLRILSAIGVRVVVMTNAAGGIHPRIAPGDIVLLEDQMNLTFRSPLAGVVVGSERRFVDMSAPFDIDLQALARTVATDLGVDLVRATYIGVPGPAYETTAEIRMLARFGGDVVGMSTVPEVIAARALGLRCVGLSVVTNRAAGLSRAPVSHEEVLRVGREAGAALDELLTELVRRLQRAQSTGAK